MGAGASSEAGKALSDASADDLAKAISELSAADQQKLKDALKADEPPKKEAGGPPPMEMLDNPFGDLVETVAVDIKDDPSHVIRFEDEEGCVRVYEPTFSKPGQLSALHYHDTFTAYLFLGNPDKPQVESAMEICQEIEGGGVKAMMAIKMPGFAGCTCSSLFFPHPKFGSKLVHRVGIPSSFAESDAQPFHQLGCEVKAWPKAATPEALPAKAAEGSSLSAPYTIPPMSPENAKFQQWRLELRPGDELPAHAFSFPAMILCGCGGGAKLVAADGGPADSPLLGLAKGDYKWLPTGCSTIGPLRLPADAEEPFVVSVVEFRKEGFS